MKTNPKPPTETSSQAADSREPGTAATSVSGGSDQFQPKEPPRLRMRKRTGPAEGDTPHRTGVYAQASRVNWKYLEEKRSFQYI